MNIIPIILAGGSGTRLWPLSRESYPKQFLRLTNENSLLQETVLRLKTIPNLLDPIVICNDLHYFICLDQLNEINVTNAKFIIEPMGRNTAPAIAAAAFYAQQLTNEDTFLLVLPSDHLIKDHQAFANTVDLVCKAMPVDSLATFGVKPTAPSTAYGYIKVGSPLSSELCQIEQFVEKPNLSLAESFLKSGDYLWNSGMFLFSAQRYLDELNQFEPDIYTQTYNAFKLAKSNHQYLHLDAKSFEACPSKSIDYAVMEKTTHAVIAPLASDWSDLGCWNAVSEALPEDANSNVIVGESISIDTTNCFINSSDKLVATAGIHNQIIVCSKDAILIADKSYAQEVKTLVEQLKTKTSVLASTHTKVHRPWGYYESLVQGAGFQVKLIMVKPGAKLSLQMHYHRAEHWVVVDGEAEVTCGENVFTLHKDQSTYIPQQSKHRLANNTDKPLHIIEVQSGDYVGEDDIVRFEDIYNRVVETA